MRVIKVQRLQIDTPLPFAIYHQSGKQLHKRGEKLSPKHLYLLKDAGIEEVHGADKLERPARVEAEMRTAPVATSKLTPGHTVARPVISDSGKVIADSGKRLSRDLIDFIGKNEITEVWVERDPADLHVNQVKTYLEKVKKHIEDKEPIPGYIPITTAKIAVDMLRDIGGVLELEKLGTNALRVKVEGEPLLKRLPPLDPTIRRTKKDIETQREIYNASAKKVEIIFNAMRAGVKVQLSDVDSVIGDVLRAALKDRCLLLALMHQPREGEYLFTHTINVVTLAVNLALVLGYDEKLLKELTYAAFFNDVGMLKVPDDIRNKPGRLTDEEAAEVRNHTTYSVRMLKGVEGIPEMLPLIVFQSHEFIDGSGYPRNKKEDEIHDLAKVLSVATFYSAMISNRPHRAGLQPYKAIGNVLQEASAKSHKYDPSIVKALVKAINIFPVGSWVKLTDGSVGVVTVPNPDEFTRPYVRVVAKDGNIVLNGTPAIATNKDVQIEKAIDAPSSVNALQAFYIEA